MADFYHFEDVFGSNPNLAYDEDTRGRIRHHRQSLENELFVDRLLKALGIRKSTVITREARSLANSSPFMKRRQHTLLNPTAI